MSRTRDGGVAGMGVNLGKEPTAAEPCGAAGGGPSDRSVLSPPSPALERPASGEPRTARGGLRGPGKREGTRPGR